MANELIKKNFKDIADSIRAKTGDTNKISAEDFPTEIGNSLAKKPSGNLSITENNTYDVSTYASVEVNVAGFIPTGTISITSNGNNIDVSQYAKANVNVPVGVFPSGTYIANDNGFYDISSYQYVNVNVPSTEGLDDYLIIDPEFVERFDFSGGNLSKIIVEGTGGLFAVKDSSSFWISNMRYGNLHDSHTSYFAIDNSFGDASFYPDGEGSGIALTGGIKVRMPVAIDAEYYYYEGVEIELSTGGQEGLLLDGSQQFDLGSYGDIVIEFYDLTGKHKLAQYSINQMWKGSSC